MKSKIDLALSLLSGILALFSIVASCMGDQPLSNLLIAFSGLGWCVDAIVLRSMLIEKERRGT